MFGFDNSNFSQDFWPGFWGNLLADFIVGIVLVGIISWLRYLITKPSLKVKVRLSPHMQGYRLLGLNFALWNDGQRSFPANEIYVHIFIDPNIQVNTKTMSSAINATVQEVEPGQPTKQEIRKFTHLQAFFSGPQFPGTEQDVVLLAAVVRRPGVFRVYYFSVTSQGLFPRRPVSDKIRRWWNEIRGRTNDDFAPCGVLKLDLRDQELYAPFGKVIFTSDLSSSTTPPAPDSTPDPA